MKYKVECTNHHNGFYHVVDEQGNYVSEEFGYWRDANKYKEKLEKQDQETEEQNNVGN